MTEIRYVAIDSRGRVIYEEKNFKIIYKIVNSFNHSHNDTKLKIAKKVIVTKEK